MYLRATLPLLLERQTRRKIRTLLNKKENAYELAADEARIKSRITIEVVASKVWAPTLNDGKEEPILTTTRAFNNNALCGNIIRAMILTEDYYYTIIMDEKENIVRLDRARYLVNYPARSDS